MKLKRIDDAHAYFSCFLFHIQNDRVLKFWFRFVHLRVWIKSGNKNKHMADSVSPQKLKQFECLQEDGKVLADEGKLQEALEKFEEARKIINTPRISQRIQKLKSLIAKHNLGLQTFQKLDEGMNLAGVGKTNDLQQAFAVCSPPNILRSIKELEGHIKTNEEEEDETVEICNGFQLCQKIYKHLYPHQRDGVSWMWGLYKAKKGGVLGDDMGLGKTFQVIAFLSGMIHVQLIKHILIVMPVSLIPNWQREFNKWSPGIQVYRFHSGTKQERDRNLSNVQSCGHVLLTSYGMVISNIDELRCKEGKEFVWDYVVLDEGQKIKNVTKTTKAIHNLPSKNRLVLTGTPIENNLRELWSMFDFAHQGMLMGTKKSFKKNYECVITQARERDATADEKFMGTKVAERLRNLIRPYFLRRTKPEVWNKKSDVNVLAPQLQKMLIAENPLPRKNDLIVWIYLSPPQIKLYKDILSSEILNKILLSDRSPLVELNALKKVCDHVQLLSKRACMQLELNVQISTKEMEEDETIFASSIENVSDNLLMLESGKMKFVIELLHNLRNNSHRTLVFSKSRKILDMIHRILVHRQWKVMRIDGTVSKVDEREQRIKLFQEDTSYPVFLLTTQVGGVGITLTAADRVIIYDPSWNPATDAQAVDRVYRIGQTKDVVVYRLITCGTVEEKIYRRQVFKESINRQVMSDEDPLRYFSRQELKELFIVESFRRSATQDHLSKLHSNIPKMDDNLDEHIAYLCSLNVYGVSHHDMLFTNTDDQPPEESGSPSPAEL